MASEQLVVFQLAAEEYAIPISQVKEIIRYSGATQMPDTPEYVEGIVNLRGKVIPVIHLAKKFNFRQGKNTDTQALIVEAASQEIGIVVDAVTEVIRLDEGATEEVSGIAWPGEFIKAIGKVEKRLLIILDLDKLFNQAEMTVVKASGRQACVN